MNAAPIRSRAPEIVAGVQVSAVYQALTGVKPRRTGKDTCRAPATWRGGDGNNVSLDDSRGVWHDFVTNEGGGVLDLVIRVRGGNRADALRWCADLAGMPMDDTPLSAAERARWARERREIERDTPAARYWRRAAVTLGEETLVNLKAALFDPTLPRPEIGEIADITQQVTRWVRLDGAELVSEYRAWREREPGLTAGMVHAARLREKAEVRALLRYMEATA